MKSTRKRLMSTTVLPLAVAAAIGAASPGVAGCCAAGGACQPCAAACSACAPCGGCNPCNPCSAH